MMPAAFGTSASLLSLAAAMFAMAAGPAAAEAPGPMWYLDTLGQPGGMIADLTWGLLILSIVVVVMITALVMVAVRGARRNVSMPADHASVKRPSERVPLRWIYGGLAATALVLIGFTVWTIGTMVAIAAPEEDEAALTIEITGHQWWWEVRYAAEEPPLIVETANEIWIPVGRPVRFKLTSADVIHTFWVPALAGKTDLIPGQVNTAWFQADVPGVFRGQCNEYCGLQHAHMGLRIFAAPEDEFREWYDAQLEPADLPEAPEALAGRDVFIEECGACHTVRGTIAGGEMGPDLTHLMSRTTLAAAMLPNTVGHLSGWIANPQQVKPGTHMPNPDLSGPQLEAVRSYLVTLE
ncbi:cytochrome c oxidase subunit II [Palleronia sp.]|uniref:cytochrome c oxidase subunit II n=1 Tax=Palleronia sp. TaxID=1940284 RepID=UPI0035C86D9D